MSQQQCRCDLLRSAKRNAVVLLDGQRMIGPLELYVRPLSFSAHIQIRFQIQCRRINRDIVREPAEFLAVHSPEWVQITALLRGRSFSSKLKPTCPRQIYRCCPELGLRDNLERICVRLQCIRRCPACLEPLVRLQVLQTNSRVPDMKNPKANRRIVSRNSGMSKHVA